MMSKNTFSKSDLVRWLKEESEEALSCLFTRADSLRQEQVGSQIHLRGLIEVSNYCNSACAYCGMHAGNRGLQRYRMSESEILQSAQWAHQLGFGSVVLQAGEDPKITGPWLATIIAEIKSNTPLAVTLSMGERSKQDWALWREAGADRYLLRFETSNDELFAKIHPKPTNRLSQLPTLKKIGYQVGSGVMIGIPGQSYESLAEDLLIFKKLDLDMIGVGPYLAHPETRLGRGWAPEPIDEKNQVPVSVLMTCKVLALARILRPDAHIPSTTALATLGGIKARIKGLQCGANVLMPNVTPESYRADYQIYPGKQTLVETAGACKKNLIHMLNAIGRTPGKGPGHRLRPQLKVPIELPI